MATFVESSPASPSTTIRHSWRVEVFSDYGDDPEIKAHRQTVTYDTNTGAVIKIERGPVVRRMLSAIPDGPKKTISALYALTDQWDEEDRAAALSQEQA